MPAHGVEVKAIPVPELSERVGRAYAHAVSPPFVHRTLDGGVIAGAPKTEVLGAAGQINRVSPARGGRRSGGRAHPAAPRAA